MCVCYPTIQLYRQGPVLWKITDAVSLLHKRKLVRIDKYMWSGSQEIMSCMDGISFPVVESNVCLCFSIVLDVGQSKSFGHGVRRFTHM